MTFAQYPILKIADRRWFRKLLFFYRIIDGLSPPYLRRFLPQQNINTSYTLREVILADRKSDVIWRNLIWRITKKLNFGGNLIWRIMQK